MTSAGALGTDSAFLGADIGPSRLIAVFRAQYFDHAVLDFNLWCIFSLSHKSFTNDLLHKYE